MIQNVLMLCITKPKIIIVGPGPEPELVTELVTGLGTGPGLEPGPWLVIRSELVAEPGPRIEILTGRRSGKVTGTWPTTTYWNKRPVT